jgi:hypothetical protein
VFALSANACDLLVSLTTIFCRKTSLKLAPDSLVSIFQAQNTQFEPRITNTMYLTGYIRRYVYASCNVSSSSNCLIHEFTLPPSITRRFKSRKMERLPTYQIYMSQVAIQVADVVEPCQVDILLLAKITPQSGPKCSFCSDTASSIESHEIQSLIYIVTSNFTHSYRVKWFGLACSPGESPECGCESLVRRLQSIHI